MVYERGKQNVCVGEGRGGTNMTSVCIPTLH